MSEWTRPSQPVRCVVDLTAPLTVRRERGVLVQGDENANAIVAEVYQSKGVPFDLTGSTVTLTFVRPDNLAVPPITAEITGNVAVMTLTDICYRVSGLYAASVKLQKGTTERTIVRVLGDIISTENDGTVTDEQILPTPEELLEMLAQAEQARDDANTAADRANTAAARAESLSIDASGYAGDANNLGGKPPEYYLPAVNLFDNSDWRDGHFIAQAGFVATHGNDRYMGDRWKVGSFEEATLTDDGIIVNSGDGAIIYQVVSGVAGKTFTFGIKTNATSEQHLSVYSSDLADGLQHIWGYPNNDGIICGTVTLPSNIDKASFVIYPELGAKYSEPVLYAGSYTAETLPPFVPKGYAAEMAECKRYYRALYRLSFAPYNVSTSIRYYRIPIEPPMRDGAVPTVTANGYIERPLNEWTDTSAEISVANASVHEFTLSATSNISATDCSLVIDEITINSDL